MFLDGDEEISGVGRGVLHGDSSLLVRVMSVSSITVSSKVAEIFCKPQIGHSQGHEDISNTESMIEYHFILYHRSLKPNLKENTTVVKWQIKGPSNNNNNGYF